MKEQTFEEVVYEDKRLGRELHESDDDPDLLPKDLKRALLHTKSHHWKYEQEVRRLILLAKADEEGPRRYYRFNGDMILREIVLGERNRLTVPEVERMIDAINSDIHVSKARLAFRSFNVVPDGKHLATNIEQRFNEYLAGPKKSLRPKQYY